MRPLRRFYNLIPTGINVRNCTTELMQIRRGKRTSLSPFLFRKSN
jgi:hypothetical protein